MHIPDHSLMPVLAAALICLLTAASGIGLLGRALASTDSARRQSLVSAGALLGSGVWLTHFVALLGFHAHGVTKYLALPTLASLILGPVTFALSLLALRAETSWNRGLIAGCGIAIGTGTLHYTGMAALSGAGQIQWSPALVVLSFALAVFLAAPAIGLVASGRAGALPRSGAVLLFTLSVVALHFTGMAAVKGIKLHGGGDGMLALSVPELLLLVALIGAIIFCWIATLIVLTRNGERRRIDQLRELELLINGVKDTAIYMLDTAGNVRTWNQGAFRLKGYKPEEIIGQHFSCFYPLEDRQRGAPEQALAKAMQTGVYEEFGRRVRSDGSWFYAAVAIEPIFDEAGRHHGFAKVTRDITALRRSEEHLNTALKRMRQGLLLFDDKGKLILHNRRAEKIFRLRSSAGKLEQLKLSLGSDQAADGAQNGQPDSGTVTELTSIIMSLLANEEGGSTTAEIAKNLVVSISASPMPEGGAVVTLDDITIQHRSAKRLEFMANHDPLTGLPNRERFTQLARLSIESLSTSNRKLLIAIVDLNNFKEINDTHGHEAGDEMLRQVAIRLRSVLKSKGEAARLGGDEFALYAEVSDEVEASTLASSLSTALDFSIIHSGEEVRCTGSLGYALATEDGNTTKELFSNADLAMYRAKRSPTCKWCRYSSYMDEEARERRELQSDFRLALERGEFHIDYQVQCSVSDGSTTGYEALLRWDHPVKGLVSPDSFISPAEESGLILAIGEWVLRTVCREAANWGEPHKVAVNVSAVQLVQDDFPDIVTSALIEAGLSPRRLELEVTETAIISDKLRALHNLRRIKALGVSIAIDDFGTGYSSLDTLNSFAFDKIKIDRSFLMGVKKGDHSRTIVKAVLALGRSLNLPVLAEGVETEEDVKLLKDEQCQEAQGFYFGCPSKLGEGEEIGIASGSGEVNVA